MFSLHLTVMHSIVLFGQNKTQMCRTGLINNLQRASRFIRLPFTESVEKPADLTSYFKLKQGFFIEIFHPLDPNETPVSYRGTHSSYC